jgi:predicted ATPase
MEPGSPAHAPIHWDRERIKDLLCAPQHLVQAEPWGAWLRQRGGLAAVYAELRAYPLPKRQRATLGLILDNPGLTAQQYADQLGVDSTTFFRYRLSLFETLQIYLNASRQLISPAPPRQAPASNLGAPLTSFVGRRHELQLIGDRLSDPAIRLLTLVGTGGSGKTRLACELARRVAGRYADGVCFVGLAALGEAELLPAALIQALGLPDSPGLAPLDWLTANLCDKELLLVIDNFEQLLPAAALLTRLLEAAPRLQVLVTSRARLHLACEYLVDVLPLSLPDPADPPRLEALSDYDAIRLFVERAAAVRAGFAIDEANAATVVDICQRLEGLPLAIELAAARIRHLSLPMMRHRLQNRLIFLSGCAPDRPLRHQTLRAVFAWSYDLLTAAEQQVFRCLATFAGGCTLAQIEELLTSLDPASGYDAFDVLAALVDKSVVQLVERPGQEARYTMLGTVREYALEQLHEHGDGARVAQIVDQIQPAERPLIEERAG